MTCKLSNRNKICFFPHYLSDLLLTHAKICVLKTSKTLFTYSNTQYKIYFKIIMKMKSAHTYFLTKHSGTISWQQ